MWEGVGVCSYLLVHFWYTRVGAVKSALNAMFTNRVGDYFLTLGFFAIFFTFGTLDYATIFSLAPYININVITFISILLLLGAAAKSAQIGLHQWLPQAMEGPTPVSSLIHAATMVTAGVYLLIRCSPLLEQSDLVLIIIMITGAVTTFFAASVGLFQNDIKKVIAYSTMSQLARECIFVNRTVCVEIIYIIYINYISKIINSQITKAHDNYYYHNSYSFFNSFLKWKIIIISKLVGISEAIRSILIDIKINKNIYLIILIYKIFFLLILIKVNYNKFIIILFLKNSYLLYFRKKSKKGKLIYRFYQNLCRPLQYCNLRTDSIKNLNSINSIVVKKNFSKTSNNNSDLKFNEWLAGVFDGDGCFILSKNGYVSCEITMDIRDKHVLVEIEHKYGGSVKSMSGANAVRYRVRHKLGVINLINAVNGLIRNPVRMLQLNKLCQKYNILFKEPLPLTYNNGWLSGFIDSDGSIYFNEKSGQVFISITQKNKYLLDPLINLYGGKIYILSPKIDAFKYSIFRKNEILKLKTDYFSKYPLRTAKYKRLNIIEKFFELRPYCEVNSKTLEEYNKWILFKDQWEKYKN